jgi:hypothetical protein
LHEGQVHCILSGKDAPKDESAEEFLMPSRKFCPKSGSLSGPERENKWLGTTESGSSGDDCCTVTGGGVIVSKGESNPKLKLSMSSCK